MSRFRGVSEDRNTLTRNWRDMKPMRRILNAIAARLMPRTVYVVCRAEDGSRITDVEVYTDHDRAQGRQQALGTAETCYAERVVDDPRHAKQHARRQAHLAEMRKRYA